MRGTQILQQQQGCEVAQFAFVGHREHGAQALQVYVVGTHVVVGRRGQAPHFCQGGVRALRYGFEHGLLRGPGPRVHQVQDRALVLTDNAGVRART